MRNPVFLALAVVFLSTIPGCASNQVKWEVGCKVQSNHTWNCGGSAHGHFKQTPDAMALDAYDLSNFSGSALSAKATNENAIQKSSSAPAFTVELYRNDKIIGAKTFDANLSSSGSVTPANPGTLTNWVRQYSGRVDDFDITVSGLDYALQPGTNTVTLEVSYDNQVQGGASDSLYISDICYYKPWSCADVNL